jgi:DNA replication protein DnaC
LNGKPLAGTGVWCSQLLNSSCPSCIAARQIQQQNERAAQARRAVLVELLGGEKPYREFTFEQFRITPGNRRAYERCRQFSPATQSLYLWGPCGVGKTHLACAMARRCFEETLAVTILRAAQVSRKVRMKDPAQEQAVIDELAGAEVLVIDDLGAGPDTAFSRYVLQEILDCRDFHDQSGLIVTSKYSLDDLAAKLADDSIPSRVAGLCECIEMRDSDHRIAGARRGALDGSTPAFPTEDPSGV